MTGAPNNTSPRVWSFARPFAVAEPLRARWDRLRTSPGSTGVNGRDGKVAKGVLTAISNMRRGSGDDREEEATALQWTLWGKQAESAAEYLGKGSHVNIVGRVRNNIYRDAQGNDVYGLAFTCEEIDFLERRADAEARRARQEAGAAPAAGTTRSRAPSSNSKAASTAYA